MDNDDKNYVGCFAMTILITLMVMIVLFVIISIVMFGFKMLKHNFTLGIAIMVSPLVFVIVAFEVGEYF